MVFLDTVGVIALFDEDDQWHAGAADAFERVLSTIGRMVTTPHILWELCWTTFAPCADFQVRS
jgi:predicted nucleic acid-binding protein